MTQVTIRINGRGYEVACGPGEEERIAGLAAYVDGKVRDLVASLGDVGDQRLLVLTSLLLADELWELRESGAAARNGGDARAASIEALADRLDRLIETLEAS